VSFLLIIGELFSKPDFKLNMGMEEPGAFFLIFSQSFPSVLERLIRFLSKSKI
jgi:hypothetical protein